MVQIHRWFRRFAAYTTDAMRRLYTLLAALFSLSAVAQQPGAGNATAANPDGSITFRYSNAGAQTVTVETDAVAKPLPMQKDDKGMWSVTTPPLKPEHYGYAFKVDGGPAMLDPTAHTLRPNLVSFSSDILVPGSTPQPWELTGIPHGKVTRHVYTTHIATGLPANQEPYLVYTPPGYDPKHSGGYPTLYLLHGWSDTEVGWTAVGQAQLILDTLLSQGKIVPMVVVMPQGYGDYSFVTSGFDIWNNAAKVDDNVGLFSEMLTEEILPAVERDYAVAKDRDHRAVAGLSMGGLESLTLGLTHHELFSYVVGMSSAVHGEKFDQHFPALAAGDKNSGVGFKLLWVACGTEDQLINPNRRFVTWAKSKGLPITAVETPGQHTWLVWRQNLLTVAPLLFK
ncbi:MAG: esterase [Janthinobacterium lividum]